jgi:hypothetical protein
MSIRKRGLWAPVLWLGGIGVAAGSLALAGTGLPLPTQLSDFYLYGTQPQTPRPPNLPGDLGFNEMTSVENCAGCHATDISVTEQPFSYSTPYNRWSYSMMSQSFRDPIFLAAMQVTEKVAVASSDSCMRCHAPAGWVQDRGVQPDGSGRNGELIESPDRQGVNCISCHRQVDPANNPGVPAVDAEILAALGADRPPNFPAVGERPGSAIAANGAVFDPEDRRRGPVDLGFFFYHQWLESDFHRQSAMCASCHDVSNALFMKQPDGSYALTPYGQPHPTGNKYDMYPMDRTYSEWLKSAFAQGPVTLTIPNPSTIPVPNEDPTPGAPPEPLANPTLIGRYQMDGVTIDETTGEKLIFRQRNEDGFRYVPVAYDSCQSCHQPKSIGTGCDPALGPQSRNVPIHNFAGTNSWVLNAVNDLYPSGETLMERPEEVTASVQRNLHMRRMASDMELSRVGPNLRVRVINQTGHKLPGGFAEGRRMWINVRFLNGAGGVVQELGAYDSATAVLDEASTKVYEAKHGLDAAMALETGLPMGPTFHLDLNNKTYLDNRIPPRGFTNAGFEAIGAAPVGATYADGQFWDDTDFAIPAGAVRAEVSVFGQTTTREYIEFLRSHATDVSTIVPQPGVDTWTLPTIGGPFPPLGAAPYSLGDIVFAQWYKWGKSAPVEMDAGSVLLACSPADIANTDGDAGPDGTVDNGDFSLFFSAFFADESDPARLLADVANTDGDPGADGTVDNGDFTLFFSAFFVGCP